MSELNSEQNAKGGCGRGIARPYQNSEKLCYTIPEAAELIGVSRNFGYELARRGEIPTRRFGKRIFVPRALFDKMLGVPPESEADL